MGKKIVLLAGLAVLVGCGSSGPVPIGNDMYTIYRKGNSSLTSTGEIKVMVMREANEFCTKQGKILQMVNTNQGTGYAAFPEADVTFKCVAKDK